MSRGNGLAAAAAAVIVFGGAFGGGQGTYSPATDTPEIDVRCSGTGRRLTITR